MIQYTQRIDHFVTIQTRVNLAKAKSQFLERDIFRECCPHYYRIEWIQYMSFLIKKIQMLILCDVAIRIGGAI